HACGRYFIISVVVVVVVDFKKNHHKTSHYDVIASGLNNFHE
ncbi:MAG: hypothetical protein ACI90V_011838, partial [Bacillariaceae sp.]